MSDAEGSSAQLPAFSCKSPADADASAIRREDDHASVRGRAFASCNGLLGRTRWRVPSRENEEQFRLELERLVDQVELLNGIPPIHCRATVFRDNLISANNAECSGTSADSEQR